MPHTLKTALKKYFLVVLLIGTSMPAYLQNLVPNPDFETFTTCPLTFQGICQMYAPPWSCPTTGSSDYYNACGGPSSPMGVPDNNSGYQDAHSGFAYSAVITRTSGGGYREYLKAPLTQPLTGGLWYHVSFYVVKSENGCPTQHMGAFLTSEDIMIPNSGPLMFEPQVENDGNYMNDEDNWLLIQGCFEAAGGEQFIIIGNFESDADTPLEPGCTSSYYFIDDVSVIESDAPGEIPLDLGGPEEACFSYEIDPEHPGPYFLWSDGSTGPTLVVNESGTYAVTVSDGCNYGIDSIEVIIAGSNPPVDLGPAAVTICNGETYSISLDPDLHDYEWNDGSNSPDYSITESGIYSVTLDDGCTATTDQVEVEVLDPPAPFELGDDFDLCADADFVFSFDPTLGDFIWQDNSTSSTFTVTQGGTYAVTISNMCGMESDEITINDIDIPTVNLGPQDLVLCTGEVIEIELDPQMGVILWQDGSDEPVYEISTPGFYSVSITNMCGTNSDEMSVSFLDPPVADLGPDVQLCEGDTLQLSANNVPGNYLWQDNSTGNDFIVTVPGTYSLIIDNQCGSHTDDITITYIQLVFPPDFGPDVSLCPGETIVLYANNPSANHLWQDMSNADTLLVSASGSYSVQVSNMCSTASDTIVVAVNDDPPQVDLPSQLSLCQGQTITLDASITGVDYLWNDNSQSQQLVVNSAGTYSLTVTNTCGSDADTTIITDGGPAPLVELGNDVALCSGDVITLSPTFSNVDSWVWQDGSTMSSYTVSGAGTVTVEVINTCGNSFDTLQATLLPPVPPLDLGADTSLCPGESFTLSVNIPGVTILWDDGSIDPDYNVSSTGLVYASITNSCGTSYDTILVDALPDVPLLNLGNDQSLCPGETITIIPGIADVIYQWQDGSTGPTYQTTQEETIILTIANECGTSTDTLEVIENTQGPQLELGPDIQVCAGEMVTISAGISGVDYVWQDGSTNPVFTTNQSGEFILQVSNNCGVDADTILVDISGVPPTVTLGSDTTLCEGEILTLLSSANAETSVEWQDGSSTSTFEVNSPGLYSLAESNRCGDATDSILVSYLNAPDQFFFSADDTLCPGETVTLVAPITTFDIRWQDGSNQPTFIADHAGTFSLQVSNDCGSVSDEFILAYDTRVPQLNFDPSLTWCEGDIITLDATQPFPAEYLWNAVITTPVLQINMPGTYNIEVSTLCSSVFQNLDVVPATDCEIIEVHTEIHIPNIFSPNGDNINDLFQISFGPDIELTAMHGAIFDRWGDMIYNSTAVPFIWDGYSKNERLLPGVYVYRIECKYLAAGSPREEVFTGDVTVIR